MRYVRFDDGVQLTPIGGDGAQARSVPSQEVRVNKTSKTAEAELKFKRREDRARDGVKAAGEYEAAAVATREKTTRLKALREAKEAADAAAEAAKPAVVKAAKPKKAPKAKKV
jgi:hypothetical protein